MNTMQPHDTQWSEDILNSFDGITRPEPDAALFARIKSKINSKQLVIVSRTKVWVAAASFILLMFLNALVIKSFVSNSRPAEQGTLKIIQQYQLNPGQLDLY